MRKAIMMLFAVLAIIPVAMATVEVDCDDGWWDGADCMEWNVQEAFNDQDDRDDSQDHRMGHIEDDVEDNEDDIHDLKHDMRDNDRKDRKQDMAIGLNYMLDGIQGWQINNLQSSIDENSDKWSEDKVGDGGMHYKAVRELICEWDFTDQYDSYNEYIMAYIDERFTLMEEKFTCMLQYEDERLIRNCQAMMQSERTGQEYRFEDGTWCDQHGCIRGVTG